MALYNPMANETVTKLSGYMGLQFGLDSGQGGAAFQLCKRKFRWLLRIDGLCSTTVFDGGINVLPPLKSARPQVSFKEMEVRHLNEHVYYPMKPEWKTINLILYDLQRTTHPVWAWLKKCYNPQFGNWYPSLTNEFVKKDATLKLYDGCGTVVETWQFENVWPQTADFGDLDMGNSEYLTCDLTLRYARAWIEENANVAKGKAGGVTAPPTGSLLQR